MIKKSIIAAVILLALHGIVVLMNPVPNVQYTLQENTVKAQTFIYEEDAENVIVGSSLSNRLVMDSLPEFYNLSFAGLSVFDGLYLMSFHEKKPENIFIEMNVIQRVEDENFMAYVNSPILGPLKKHVPSLRDGYQPVGILGENLIRSIKGESNQNDLQQNKAEGVQTDNSVFTRLLDHEIKQYSETLDKQFMTERFEQLKTTIDKLEDNGVNIFFFEMPVNEKLCDLSRPRIIREFFHTYFPATEYPYIATPNCQEYKTTDGVHLAGEEASKYTKYFKDQANVLMAGSSLRSLE
jgi:hypothetical protein